MGEPEKNEQGEKSEEKKIDIFERFFYIFFCIFYIIVSTDIILKMINYILEKSDKIIELSFMKLLTTGFNYLKNYDYNSSIFYTMLLTIILLMFYLTIIFIYSTKLKETKLIIIIIVFVTISFFFFCIFYEKDEDLKENTLIFIYLFILLVVLIVGEKILNENINVEKFTFTYIKGVIVEKFTFTYIKGVIVEKFTFTYIKGIIKKYVSKPSQWVKDHRVRLIIIIFSFCSYTVICFLIEGERPKVFNFPLIIFIIFIGILLYGIAIERIAISSREIIVSILKKEELPTQKKKKLEMLIADLKIHINSLLIEFLIATLSYLFINIFIAIFQIEELSSFLNTHNIDLSFILIIPLYVFFYKGGSEILKRLIEEIYDRIECTLSIPQNDLRKESFIKVFDRLTKIGIIFLIIFNISNIFNESTEFKSLFTMPSGTFEYIIKIAITAPIIMWILVLLLDPFFERETIQAGENTGKIRNVGFLFTKLETLTGEHIYIPNAELLARTIKRLNARGPKEEDSNPEKDKTKNEKEISSQKKDKIQDQKGISHQKKENIKYEKGIIINFQCTLNYSHELCIIRGIFDELFEDKNKITSLNEYFNKAGFEMTEERIKDILSDPCQFVSIEEFKDHGVVYGFNFRVKDSFHAPIFRSYFMSKFKEKMETEIITPSKIEISTVYEGKFT